MRQTTILTAILAAVLTLPGPARAKESGQDRTTVDAFSGSFTTAVPIDVPKYRGLEPALSLTYRSGGGNGLVGVGWGLAAGSIIERGSAGHGTPNYDSGDVFYVDGQELVPCTLFGGNYCTRIHSYARILADWSNNKWYIWRKDGTKQIYSALYQTSKGTFRYALTAATDPLGNTVDYAYSCSDDCYLSSITYNGTMVSFFYETRPDPLTFATGAGLGTTKYRLRSIFVWLPDAGKVIRVYHLLYTTSDATARSRLMSVRQFGSDVTHDGGVPNGGTGLPGMQLFYQEGANVFERKSWATSTSSMVDDSLNYVLEGDFNGDGRSDLAITRPAWNSFKMRLSTGSGFTSASWATDADNLSHGYSGADAGFNYNYVVTGDFNGDGKTDIAMVRPDWNYFRVRLSTGSGFTSHLWALGTNYLCGNLQCSDASAICYQGPAILGNCPSQQVPTQNWVQAGDFNGDGKTDIAFTRPGQGGWRVYLSSGSSFSYHYWSAAGIPHLTSNGYDYEFQEDALTVVSGDFNGDGKTDFAMTQRGDLGWTVHLSTGSGFDSQYWAAGGAAGAHVGGEVPSFVRVGDLNGDGKTDIAIIRDTWNGWRTYLSTGSGFVESLWSTGSNQLAADGESILVSGDFNGDGRTDFAYTRPGWGGWRVYTSTGTGFTEELRSTSINSLSTSGENFVLVGDFTGDGLPDIASTRAGWSAFSLEVSTGSAPDLLAQVANGLGGRTTVSYTPSSEWTNTFLPVGLVLQTASAVTISDGRELSGDAGSHVSATTYTYEGALWNSADREFLGFRRATTAIDASGAYAETYYWQRQGCIAKPEAIYKRQADGTILSFEQFRFTENLSPPYTSLVTEVWAYECNGNGVFTLMGDYVSGCRRVLTTYAWDPYANLVTETQHGDYDVAGDERTILRIFYANQPDHIVGLPAWENMYQGLGHTGTLMTSTVFYYDSQASWSQPPVRGLLTKKIQWSDQDGTYAYNYFGYDAYGNETSLTDPLGRTATKAYDAVYHTFVTATTNPLGHTMRSTYDAVFGQVLTRTDPDGNVTSYQYDVHGRPTRQDNADSSAVKYEYLDDGDPEQQRIRQSVWNPDTGSWIWEDNYFDGLQRGYKKASQTGVQEEVVFGLRGKPSKKSLPHLASETPQWDTFGYDVLGRELWVTHPDGSTLRRVYGNDYVQHLDALGSARTVWSDAFGRVARVRERANGADSDTTFTYDVVGRRLTSTDAAGNVTAAVYNSLGQMLQKSDPDQGLWRYEHNLGGELVAETDALGRRTALAYDTLGRVTRRTYADGSYDSFAFDEAGRGSSTGRLTTATSAAGVVTKASYDSMGRRAWYSQTLDDQTHTVSHDYDTAGRLMSVTYPDGEVVTYGYGTSGLQLGRLTTVSGKVTGITYTAKGQLASMTYANGVTTTFGLDASRERVAQIQIGSLATLDYAYNANGWVTSLSSAQLLPSNWSYSYDELGRLRQATNNSDASYSESYSFSATARLGCHSKRGTYTYGDPAHFHAVTAVGSDTYAYDANGNLLSGAGRTFAYGYDHRVASLTAGGLTTTFVHNADGVRVKKSSSQGSVVYVGGLYEKRGTAAVKYYFAGAQRVAKSDASGTTYFHTDHLGSTRLITDGSGQEVKRYDYSPYGRLIAESGTLPDSHRFTGQEMDDETGLTFFHARYYDPALGRFLQPDSILPNANSPQELDPYAYANNSPVNYVDPNGHAPVLVALGAAWAVGTAATIVNICAIIIGTALTFTDNPLLQTIGMVLAGMGSAGLAYGATAAAVTRTVVAGAVALAQSPISPLDPTLKKAIGWAYAGYGMLGNIQNIQTTGEWLPVGIAGGLGIATKALPGVMAAAGELATAAFCWTVAYFTSRWGTTGRWTFAFLAACALNYTSSKPGPLGFLGSSYDLAYTLKYPDGRVIDLTGGQGGEKFTFYYHTGFESSFAFGRQHIRVGDGGGYYELGSGGAGYSGPGLGWNGWITTQKITVIMSSAQAVAFRGAMTAGAQGNGGYMGYYKDSYAYISQALEFASGKSAADLHINPGLLNF